MQTRQDMVEASSIAPSSLSSAGALQIGNERFQNALARRPQCVPPIWMMRQAGRYHRHYQELRQKHSFMDLCKQPELAAQVALGPVMDFDFDAAILFSDLLFPLEALGMGLEYTDHGPQLGWNLNQKSILAEARGLCIPNPCLTRSEEHTSELQSHLNLVCRLLLEKKKITAYTI